MLTVTLLRPTASLVEFGYPFSASLNHGPRQSVGED